jgi:hypothetical protein
MMDDIGQEALFDQSCQSKGQHSVGLGQLTHADPVHLQGFGDHGGCVF